MRIMLGTTPARSELNRTSKAGRKLGSVPILGVSKPEGARGRGAGDAFKPPPLGKLERSGQGSLAWVCIKCASLDESGWGSGGQKAGRVPRTRWLSDIDVRHQEG